MKEHFQTQFFTLSAKFLKVHVEMEWVDLLYIELILYVVEILVHGNWLLCRMIDID